MRRTALVLAVAAAAALLPAAAANSAKAVGTNCPSGYVKLYVGGGALPGAPQHRDYNGDGYLCYNSRNNRWVDNTAP